MWLSSHRQTYGFSPLIYNDFLREQLKELQADLLDMSDKELVECRSLLLERINWCMTAILERR